MTDPIEPIGGASDSQKSYIDPTLLHHEEQQKEGPTINKHDEAAFEANLILKTMEMMGVHNPDLEHKIQACAQAGDLAGINHALPAVAEATGVHFHHLEFPAHSEQAILEHNNHMIETAVQALHDHGIKTEGTVQAGQKLETIYVQVTDPNVPGGTSLQAQTVLVNSF